MAKFEGRVFSSVTLDFIVEAEDEYEAERKIGEYVKYVQYGKLDQQKIRMDLPGDDKLTACFFMENEICDVQEP